MTVDLGITNHEEVKLAQALGMTVVVTDHHGLGLEMSPADAVINLLLGSHPFCRPCCAGVAFNLSQALLGFKAAAAYFAIAALASSVGI